MSMDAGRANMPEEAGAGEEDVPSEDVVSPKRVVKPNPMYARPLWLNGWTRDRDMAGEHEEDRRELRGDHDLVEMLSCCVRPLTDIHILTHPNPMHTSHH